MSFSVADGDANIVVSSVVFVHQQKYIAQVESNTATGYAQTYLQVR